MTRRFWPHIGTRLLVAAGIALGLAACSLAWQQSMPSSTDAPVVPTQPPMTYSPGGIDMSGLQVKNIHAVPPSASSGNAPMIEIALENTTGGWYIGNLYWVLWIGDVNTTESRHGPGSSDPYLYFRFPQAEWDKMQPGEPMTLTWGPTRRDAPFAYLDKTRLDK